MRITKNFTLEELTKSGTAIRHGINNQPGQQELLNMFHLTVSLLQPLRDMIKQPITVNSCYRSRNLNELIGGARNSQHMSGQAADIESPGMDNADLFDLIRTHFVYDQLILEYYREGIPDSGWIHVSYVDGPNRMETLFINSDQPS